MSQTITRRGHGEISIMVSSRHGDQDSADKVAHTVATRIEDQAWVDSGSSVSISIDDVPKLDELGPGETESTWISRGEIYIFASSERLWHSIDMINRIWDAIEMMDYGPGIRVGMAIEEVTDGES